MRNTEHCTKTVISDIISVKGGHWMGETIGATVRSKLPKNRTEIKLWLLKTHNAKLMSIAKGKGITMSGLVRMILIEYLERME